MQSVHSNKDMSTRINICTCILYLYLCTLSKKFVIVLRLNLNKNVYDVLLEYILPKKKPLNIECKHSIWYVRYIFTGVHKITVSLKAPAIYKIS